MREENRLDWLNKRGDKLEDDMLRAMDKTRKIVLDEAKKMADNFSVDNKVSLRTALKRVSIDDMDAMAKKAKKIIKEGHTGPDIDRFMKRYNFNMRMSRADALMLNIDERLIELGYNLSATMGTYLTNHAIQEMMEQAGILGLNVQSPKSLGDLAKTIVGESFHGTTFSEDIWKNQQVLRNQLEQGLLKSLLLGQNPTKWMKVLDNYTRDAFKGSKYAIKRLAVTEGARIQSQAQKQMYEKGGYLQFEFMAETTACPICAAMDGKIYDVETLMPGINAAPIHPHCRCSTAAVYDDKQYRKEFNKLLQDIKDGEAPEDLIPEKELKKIIPKKVNIPKSIKKGTPEYDRYVRSDYAPDEIGKIGGKLVRKGEPMTFDQADNGRANPNYASPTAVADGYVTNCQTSVVAHEARLRGFDVAAIPNTKGSPAQKLSKDTTSVWTNKYGKQPIKTVISVRDFNELESLFKTVLRKDGRYHINFEWKGSTPYGHIVTIDAAPTDAGFRIYDPQINEIVDNRDDLKEYFNRINIKNMRLQRVDDLMFYKPVLDDLLVPLGD